MNAVTRCPIDELQALVDDNLTAVRSDQVISHLDGCTECRQRVDRLAGSAEDWAVAADAFSDEVNEWKRLDRLDDTDGTCDAGPGGDRVAQHRFELSSIHDLMAPSDDPRAAGRIGPFEVTGIVGSGGMGVVLKAREPSLDRYVAVKMLSPHLASSPIARRRFAREARAAAAVIHDNVIAIYQVGEWNDVPFLVMPYLPDPSLQQRIDAEGPLEVEAVISIAMQIARGLSAAHSQGLVHRDVKPANVLLSKGTERAVITDFGLARAADDASLTRAGALAGTPHYMSPEQARGASLDARSDLFSLGSVMFTMLAGRPPVHQELGSETISRIASHRVPSLRETDAKVPEWLQRLVDWLHQRDPRRRPASAQEVAGLLEQCLSHCREPLQHPLPSSLVESSSGGKRWLLIACAVALIGVVLIQGMGLLGRAPQTKARTRPVTGPTATEPARDNQVRSAQTQPNEAASRIDSHSSGAVFGWEYVDGHVADIDHDLQTMEIDLERDWIEQ